ncbi:hypothetical protein H7171_04085 [Candidatus Saccharibacteria bacterium]|nr:hypothetical protein [Candidatus Saccharibacteria bacterium]
MSDFEQREYLVKGELSPEDCQLPLQFLGKIGVTVSQLPAADMQESPTVETETVLEPGTIPYRLSEINSAEQYLSNEHLGEFWPEYRKSSPNPGTKFDCLLRGIEMLAKPTPKGPRGQAIGLYAWQQEEYTARLGIIAVRPRTKVGFADETRSGSYGLLSAPLYANSVVQVGSFIASVRSISELDPKERPFGINPRTIRFFLSLADKLETQIDPDNFEDL